MWHEVPKDGGSDRARSRILFSQCHGVDPVLGARQECPDAKHGRSKVNYLSSRKREHSRKRVSSTQSSRRAARHPTLSSSLGVIERAGWVGGNQADDSYDATWKTYADHSQSAQPELGFGGAESEFHAPLKLQQKTFSVFGRAYTAIRTGLLGGCHSQAVSRSNAG